MSEKKKNGIKEYLRLFLVFFKLGVFTFGGGYAMISLLENECVEKRKWLTSDEFFKIITIAETTPGPIAINSATYIGYTRGKILGSFLATLGVVLPSFAIIYAISFFLDNLLQIPVIEHAFNGIKAGVAVLILFGGINMFRKLNKNVFAYLLCAAALVANLAISVLAINFSTIYLILIGGALGFIAYLIGNKNKIENDVSRENCVTVETTKIDKKLIEKFVKTDSVVSTDEKTVTDVQKDEEGKK